MFALLIPAGISQGAVFTYTGCSVSPSTLPLIAGELKDPGPQPEGFSLDEIQPGPGRVSLEGIWTPKRSSLRESSTFHGSLAMGRSAGGQLCRNAEFRVELVCNACDVIVWLSLTDTCLC